MDISTLPRPDGVYIIYSMDAICEDKRIDNMGPLNEHRYWPQDDRANIGEWTLTEDNSEYQFGYLYSENPGNSMSVYLSAEDASSPAVPYEVLTDDEMPVGFGFEFSINGADYYMKMDDAPFFEETWRKVTGSQDWNAEGTEEVWEVKVEDVTFQDIPERPMGRHRKWVGMLTFEQWEAFARNYCIDLHENGMPEHYEETMGSLTEFGHLPAICIDNTEGWGDNFGDPVIDSSFYCSFFTIPRDYSNDRGAMVEDARNGGRKYAIEYLRPDGWWRAGEGWTDYEAAWGDALAQLPGNVEWKVVLA